VWRGGYPFYSFADEARWGPLVRCRKTHTHIVCGCPCTFLQRCVAKNDENEKCHELLPVVQTCRTRFDVPVLKTTVPGPSCGVSLTCSQPSLHNARSSRGCGRCVPCPLSLCRLSRWLLLSERNACSAAPRLRQRMVGGPMRPCCVCSR
jgi:hypothetical protein